MRFARMLTSVAIVAGLVLSLSGEANASTVYGYSVERLTNFSITTGSGASISSSTFKNASTFNSAATTGFPISGGGGGTDAAQAYSGVGPVPLENSFSPKGQSGPSWARGDAVIGTIPVINGTLGDMRNVAEGFLSSLNNADGIGQWSLSYEFDVITSGTLGISTSFSQELQAELVATLVGANATAAYSVSINLACSLSLNGPSCGSQSGVFPGDPLNGTTSRNTPGSSPLGPTVGATSLTAPLTLTATQHYILTINADEHISLQDVAAPIPEPGTWMLMGTGLLGLLGYGWRRKRIA